MLSKNTLNSWPLISIVIPTYNSGNSIGQVLDSVEKLDYPVNSLELLIVDGGSTDNTLDIIKNHSINKKIKTQIDLLKQRGASLGRNIGIKNSKGEYLFLLDSDVSLTRNKILKVLLEHFQKNLKIAISEAPYFTNNLSLSENVIASRLPNPYGYTRYMSPGSMLIRRNVFDEVGFFDENLGYPFGPGEDQEFAARILKKNFKIFIDSRFVNLHIKNDTNIDSKTSAKRNLNFLRSTVQAMPPIHYKIFKAEPTYVKLEILFALYPLTFLLPFLTLYLLPLPLFPFLYYFWKCKTSFVKRCKLSVVTIIYRFIRSSGVLFFLIKKSFANSVKL